MRTTIDLSDELYRTLKTRAAIKGVTLRELVGSLIEQALDRPEESARSSHRDEDPLPVAIPRADAPVTPITGKDLHELEVDDYLESLDRSS